MANFQFKLPDLGEGVLEGEIVRWLVSAGDVIREDQAVVEVMTDKATVTVPSPRGGRVVRTYGKVGDTAKVHATLADLEVEGEVAGTGDGVGASPGVAPRPSRPRASAPRPSGPRASAPRPLAPGSSAATALPPPVAPAPARVLASPVTRRMAHSLGVELSTLSGSGPGGRVLRADVEAHVARGAQAASGGMATPGGMAAPRGGAGAPAARPDERVPLRGLRKRIAEKMVRSKFTAPHYAFVEEVDVSDLVRLRARLNEGLEDVGDELRLSFLPFFCKALVAAFRRFPTVNAIMDEAAQELVVRGEYNIGVAVMTEQGLTVPVVKHVDRLGMRSLGREIARLSDAARAKRLTLDELSGGTFTVTSLGAQGGLFATPIINHPEVAILGVHRIRKRPVVREDGQLGVGQLAMFSFCFDHRTIDGALGAQFAYEFLRYVEKPELLLLEGLG